MDPANPAFTGFDGGLYDKSLRTLVRLPEEGQELGSGDEAGVVESVKAASDVYAPVSGTVVEVNEKLDEDAALVNAGAEGDGWLYKMKLSDASQLDDLLDADGYQALIS